MPFLLLHLLLRHGVDYLADAILDGVGAATRWCIRSPADSVRRIRARVTAATPMRRMTPAVMGSVVPLD